MSNYKTKLTADHLIKIIASSNENWGDSPPVWNTRRNATAFLRSCPVFGRPGWRKLLASVGAKPHIRARQVFRESLQDCYRRLKANLGRVPDSKEYEENCCSCSTLSKLFAGRGWTRLLESVGDSNRTRTYNGKARQRHRCCAPFVPSAGSWKSAEFKAVSKASPGYSLKDIRYLSARMHGKSS